jgi:hypothetical protein
VSSPPSRRLLKAALVLGALLPLAPSAATADTLVVQPVAVQDQVSPSGGRFILFGHISIDSGRRVTFTTSTTRGQVGVFRFSRAGLERLLLTGDDAPDDAGNSFKATYEAASNARGDLAFIADTFFPGRLGVFLKSGGVIRTLAQVGDPSPTPRGELFAGFDQIQLLDSGEVYFRALLTDGSSPAGAAVVKTGAAGLEPVISPGDRYLGLRAVDDVQEYDVNEAGDVVAMARITEIELLTDPGAVPELLLYSAGSLHLLASVNLSVSGGIDLVRNLAVALQQVHVTETGTAAFFAGTNNFPEGAYFSNDSGRAFDNVKILGQGDPSPVAPGDRLMTLWRFGFNAAETLVFHATTEQLPAGGLFALHHGVVSTIARAGDVRPDGTDVWHGFLQIDLNEADAFAFTDFQGLAQVGVFLGRFIPPPQVLVQQMREKIEAGTADPGVRASLINRLRPIEMAASRGDLATFLPALTAFRVELAHRSGRSIPSALAETLDELLEDLIMILGGPPPHGPPARRSFDTFLRGR